jgi:hypothetical protein
VKLGFEAIVQRGSTPARPPLETIEFLPAEELESFMLARLGEVDGAFFEQSPCVAHLVIIDVLAMLRIAGNDDGAMAAPRRQRQRAWPGVAHDHVGREHEGLKLLSREKLDGFKRWPGWCRAALNDGFEAELHLRVSHPVKEAGKRMMVSADGACELRNRHKSRPIT